MSRQLRLRGNPVRMPSKNFLANHQFDADWWTEFPYMFCRQYDPQYRVYRKRADTVGEPQSMTFQ
jgi:hypothetical protein